MKLELRDEKGLTGVFVELPLEQIKEGLGLSSSLVAESTEAEAKLQEQVRENEGNLALLEESHTKVAELEEKVATAEGKTMGDFPPEVKADFVITWAKGLSQEDVAIFCEGVGIHIAKAPEAKVAQEENPKSIQGKTDKPGYKYLPHLNMSVRE